MAPDLAARIERLLDQLENPGLSDTDIERIQKKIDYLKSLMPPVVLHQRQD